MKSNVSTGITMNKLSYIVSDGQNSNENLQRYNKCTPPMPRIQ